MLCINTGVLIPDALIWNSLSLRVMKTWLPLFVRSGVESKCWFSALILCFVFTVNLHPDLLVDFQVYGRGNIYVDIFLVCYFETRRMANTWTNV